MDPIEKEREIFKYLISKHCKKSTRNQIIQNSKGPFINKICECVLNVLNGKVKITQEEFKKLKPYKKLFRKLLKKRLAINKKKNLIIQRGGFLGTLIPIILGAIPELISKAVSYFTTPSTPPTNNE